MDWDSPIFVIVIIAMVMVTAIITTWMQSRAAARTAATDGDAELNRENARLAQENEKLRGSIRRLEERMGVLERIATVWQVRSAPHCVATPGGRGDLTKAERTAREIEELR